MKKVFSIIAALLFAGSMMAADKSVQKSVHDLFPDDPNGTQRVTLYDVDGLTISVNKKGNNGKIYNNSTEWRLYQTDAAVVTVSLASGKIKRVAFKFTAANDGTLNYNSTAMESEKLVEVNATSAEFVVGNSTSATNGQIKVTAFAVVYEAGAPDYCHVTYDGKIPFIASTIKDEGSSDVILAVATDPQWLFEDTPSTDGNGFGMEFTPKQGTRADLRGVYDVEEDTEYIKTIAFIEKDGTDFNQYTPKSGTVTILANEDEDGYDLEYELVVTVEGSDHTVAGIVYGICDDNMNIEYCHLIGSESSVGALSDMKVSDIYENSGTVIVEVASSSNYLLGLGDGVKLQFGMNPVVSRQDLRGEYTSNLQEALASLVATDDGKKSSTLCGGTFTVSLNANKTTYDIAYNLTVIVDSEEQTFSGKIKGICDSQMDIPTTIENVPAAKVNTNKVIRNGHLFIEHEGHLYNANGIQIQ